MASPSSRKPAAGGRVFRVSAGSGPRVGTSSASPGPTVFALSFAHEEVLGVGRHVEAQREGEVGVDLLLHHGHHVEGVPHGVEAQDPRQLLETGSGRGDHQPVKGFDASPLFLLWDHESLVLLETFSFFFKHSVLVFIQTHVNKTVLDHINHH